MKIIYFPQVAASDQSRVTLTDVDRTLTGEYQCEVSADAPLFHTDIKAAEMVVVGKHSLFFDNHVVQDLAKKWLHLFRFC